MLLVDLSSITSGHIMNSGFRMFSSISLKISSFLHFLYLSLDILLKKDRAWWHLLSESNSALYFLH